MHRYCFVNFLALVCITPNYISGVIYETSSRKVDLQIEHLDEFGSQTACVEYLEGADEYTTACFTRSKNGNGVFIDCKVAFDGIACNRCDVCQTVDKTIGYNLDCYNVAPTKNALSFCEEFTNTSVQEILVDDQFSAFTFDFADNSTNVTSENETSSGENSSKLFLRSVILGFGLIAMLGSAI